MRTAAGHSNGHWFETVRLWECADQIRQGELPDRAPFLILWEHDDAEGTLREEREVIQAANLPEPIRQEVLGTAYLLGLRYASRRVVDAVFREEVMKLEDMGLIGERIAARLAEQLAEADAKGLAEGLAKGRVEGRVEERVEEARAIARRLLQRRFGELPDAWQQRIDQTDAEWCTALLEHALEWNPLATWRLEHSSPGSAGYRHSLGTRVSQ